MKHLFLACCTLLALYSTAQTKKISDVAKFSSTTVDLGRVKVGSPVTGTFTVTNVGSAPLIIENVQPSCGCTKSDYTKQPIAPGKDGSITATYNAAVVGNFNKTVYVKFAGVNEQVGLNIIGTVFAETQPTTTPVKTGSK
ncbi:DUF1573 domain-containing protein [Dinghuibacter silviterrae]|uniref:Uncharacterized protein DUF1573 n=1 Tax=Dinghuibacter silviterrae TaxID=1539049 RepID=A0A4R8DR35_9BACT|nr:DUF1573 domain-containing protein [Dinghuibacter silviterrae]TDX00634.1 uncharacterized protein DUF1573 [Dinghuibacter silviterrae]